MSDCSPRTAVLSGWRQFCCSAVFGYAKSHPNIVSADPPNLPVNADSNTYAKPMSDMPPMNHNMAMGDDFAKNEQSNNDKTNSSSVSLFSSEEADKIITRITQTTEHRADGMQIIKTPKDTALVCIHNMIEMGKTHMFAVERPNLNSQWEITARISLDTPDFHGANWTFEPQDVDDDGFEDVIFHGANADDTARKVLIYVPRTRQNYWITETGDAGGKVPICFRQTPKLPIQKSFAPHSNRLSNRTDVPKKCSWFANFL